MWTAVLDVHAFNALLLKTFPTSHMLRDLKAASTHNIRLLVQVGVAAGGGECDVVRPSYTHPRPRHE